MAKTKKTDKYPKSIRKMIENCYSKSMTVADTVVKLNKSATASKNDLVYTMYNIRTYFGNLTRR